MSISANLVKDLRDKTSAGMMDCKKALEETKGDFDKAVDWLRTKGLSKAAKKADRVASEGTVASYIHAGGRIGVLLEVNSETDFVARNEDFQKFVADIAMHVAAADPTPLSVDQAGMPAEAIEKERRVLRSWRWATRSRWPSLILSHPLLSRRRLPALTTTLSGT